MAIDIQEIERLNSLLDEKLKMLETVNQETGGYIEDIERLNKSIEELKQKVTSKEKTIETMEAALYQATQKIYFLKEFIEKNSAEFNNSAPKASII